MKIRIREVLIAAVALVLLGAAVAGYIACRCDNPPTPASANQSGIPPGWTAPPVEMTPWLPFHHNAASAATAAFPAGSSVIHLTTQGGEQIEIGILPDGTVVVPAGVTAVVYKKRPPLISAEFRPFIGVGAVGPGLSAAGAVGADVVRVWRVNVGLGALINDGAVAGAGFAAYPIWRNVDGRVGGGYGTAGAVGFAGVSIGIQ